MMSTHQPWNQWGCNDSPCFGRWEVQRKWTCKYFNQFFRLILSRMTFTVSNQICCCRLNLSLLYFIRSLYP